MKRTFLSVLSFAGVLASAQYDGFTGTGALNANGWTTYGGTAGQVQIITTPSESGNSLAYPGLTSQGNRIALSSVNREGLDKKFSSPVTTTAYVSFLLKVTDTSTLQPNTLQTPPGYIAFFSPLEGADIGNTGWVSRISLRQGSSSSKYNIGVLNATGGTAGLTDLYGTTTPAEYNVGQTYLIVVKYDMTGTQGNTKLWVNPAIGSTEGTPIVSTSFGTSAKQSQIASFALRQAVATGFMELDEVRLGKTWEEVVSDTTLAVNNFTKSEALISETVVKDGFRILKSGTSSMEIYSMSGSLISKRRVTEGETINASNLQPGIYLVKITSADSQSRVVKIIKK